ncbi:uncharacterized protein LOC123545715 [Mercenaria mercenaria]|uniref:uncharacterized protein LOC123545715 n=1 Tax=Mercenaria mercenaria TaxID=6596 RepID=UPI001E1D91C8|nr:uncharacterized protein LOC123545715 [Mercenaria mercenaria]
MELYTNESILISRVLGHLGYGKEMVAFRHNVSKRLESVMRNMLSSEIQLHAILAGSKGEGLTAPLESDYDIMVVYSDVICKEYLDSVTNRGEMTVFNLDMKYAAPGYTYLRAINLNDNNLTTKCLREYLAELSPGYLYLSSDFWKHGMKKNLTQCSLLQGNQDFETVDRENHGPSTTVTLYNTVPSDLVYAFSCECPSYLRSWSNRQRFNQWPFDGVIREVSESESNVVPVGNIFSSMQFLEWRICFTKGEIILVQSLNDCLTKCLILLKQITRIALKPLCKDMTSYIVKNVIFWIAELNDYEYFKENNLSLVLKLALLFLKQCVCRNNLPSYMIPERNLLSDRLTVDQRANICMRIDYLLKEGPVMVYRWRKFRHAFIMLYRSPEEFYKLSKRRHLAQKLFLLKDEYSLRIITRSFSSVGELMRAVYNDDLFVLLAYISAKCIHEENNITKDDARMFFEKKEKFISYLRDNGSRLIRNSHTNKYLA